jgi:hypothetical protein
MPAKRLHNRRREHRVPVLAALPLANCDLAAIEVDVFHAELQAFRQAQARPVQQCCHEPRWTGEGIEQTPNFLSRQDDGQADGGGSARDPLNRGQRALEDGIVEEHSALRAWFCVDAATCRSTASEDRNVATSASPSVPGCRLPWNTM